MKIRPVGVESSHADGQKDMTRLTLFAILRTHLKTHTCVCVCVCVCVRWMALFANLGAVIIHF